MSSYFHTSGQVEVAEIKLGHSWRSEDGGLHAAVYFGSVADITLDSVAMADELIAAATKARDALAELEVSAPPRTPEEEAEFRAWRAARAEEPAS